MSDERELAGLDPSLLDGAVVVGDDGSVDSRRAVAWALDDAGRRGSPLVVVRAWSITHAPRPAGSQPGYVPSEDEFAAAVCDEMASDLRAVLGDPPGAVLMPVHAHPSEVLVHASRYAALTVVGARGRGLAKWLGSVSSAVVKGAHGPVVVVPHRSRPEA